MENAGFRHEPTRQLRLRVVVWTLLLAGPCLPSLAHADPGLSIEAELHRPGVRLLAVEFYASWCKPCMAAVPHWKALHDKYRDKGLRLVVVAVQDDGRCGNPGWNPDLTVCDEDGRISNAFRVGQNLPAAFLWSWTGRLLVQRGTVEQVSAAIEAELSGLPRVILGADTRGPEAKVLATVVELLGGELRRSGKMEVVATVDERKLLDHLRRESQNAGYAENSQCKLGEQMAANSLLTANIQTTGGQPKLFLRLFSAEKGCLTQSGIAPWTPRQPDVAVAAATADLLARMRSETQMPVIAEPPKVPFSGRKVEQGKEIDVDELDEVIVAFDSTPPGAAVFVAEKMICPQTPCSKGVALGKRTITMSSTDYVTRSESVVFTSATTQLSWPLEADFAMLNVSCDASDVPLKLDGKSWGLCPQRNQRLSPGKHTVALDSPCHLGVEERVQVRRGDNKTVTLPAVPRMAALTVKASDDSGNDVRGVASLDGERMGEVPGSFKVPMCAKNLVVTGEQMKAWSTELDLREGEKSQVLAHMQRVPQALPRYSSPAPHQAAERKSAPLRHQETARAQPVAEPAQASIASGTGSLSLMVPVGLAAGNVGLGGIAELGVLLWDVLELKFVASYGQHPHPIAPGSTSNNPVPDDTPTATLVGGAAGLRWSPVSTEVLAVEGFAGGSWWQPKCGSWAQDSFLQWQCAGPGTAGWGYVSGARASLMHKTDSGARYRVALAYQNGQNLGRSVVLELSPFLSW